ncbi:hypothetical protein BAE30_06270 [Acidithiobacillus caldus]|uniref:Uncharacterized protein n=1 Tax=Acidithiobacillus caldus TaxID=33059 RepID=A0A1E7YWY2_9PROT|nr:hypothetical protein BAE30_06270 [Acidithiobacillus caldus]
MATFEELAALYDEWKSVHDRNVTTNGKLPELDRAIPCMTRGYPSSLVLDLCNLAHPKAAPTQKQLDRKKSLGEAQKLLWQAAKLLNDAGQPSLRDLTNDIASSLKWAELGPTFMQPIGYDETSPKPNCYKTMRLYPCTEGDASALLWQTEPKGRAANAPKSAANGAAVRTIAKYFDGYPQQAAVTSRLLALAGYDVDAPTVRKVLQGYTPKLNRAAQAPDLLSMLPKPPKK